jgi:hypothetical protein
VNEKPNNILFFLNVSILHFLSVTRKKTEAKERVRKRPVSEAGCPILVATQ